MTIIEIILVAWLSIVAAMLVILGINITSNICKSRYRSTEQREKIGR